MKLLGDNIDTIEEDTQTLTDASRKDGLKINVEETKYSWCLVTRMEVNIGT
jgi:hypothetical protein